MISTTRDSILHSLTILKIGMPGRLKALSGKSVESRVRKGLQDSFTYLKQINKIFIERPILRNTYFRIGPKRHHEGLPNSQLVQNQSPSRSLWTFRSLVRPFHWRASLLFKVFFFFRKWSQRHKLLLNA